MSESIESKKEMKCCLSSNGHVVEDPILITLCNGYACRLCRDSLSTETVRCSNCTEEHKSEDLKVMKVNGLMKHLIEDVYIKELIEEVKVEVNRMVNAEESLKEEVIERIDLIENEIDIQVTSVEIELHKYRDEMINELHQLKDRLLKSTTLENIKKESEAAAQTCDHQMDHKYFQELQNRMKTMQNEIQVFKENINEINFTPGEITFDRNIIGKISIPKYKIKSDIKKGVLGAILLWRGCYSKLKDMIVLSNCNGGRLKILDCDGGDLKILDCDGNYLDSLKHEPIMEPGPMYVDKTDKLYLHDHKQKGVLVFDSNMTFLSKFDCPELKGDANYLEIDEDHKDKLIYIADSPCNRIEVYNGYNGHFVKSIDIHSPLYMKFNSDKFYITSATWWDTSSDGKFDEITSGSNCIFVLDRVNHNLLHKLEHPNLLGPRGLRVNEDGSNILTTALYKDDDGNISEFRHLFVFDRNYNLIQNVEIQGECDGLNNVLFFESKILFCYSKSIQIHEIDNKIK